MTRRRTGITMTEVLVALFIMALGAIAILTMFPLGVIQMGQAFKDDRTAQAANQADTYMRWYWKTYVVENQTDQNLSSNFATCAFDNPGGGLPPPLPTEPSYPVVVDPIGAIVAPGGGTVAQVANTLLPRRTLWSLNGQPAGGVVLRPVTLLDGLTYDTNGQAADRNGNNSTSAGYTGQVDRDTRYNWLWILQRPSNRDPKTATMTVVVFDRRAPFYQAPNGELAFPNTVFTPGTTAVVIQYPAGQRPEVQKGQWVMDASIIPGTTVRQAVFYRVVGVTDGANNTITYDLQTPIRRADGQTLPYTGTLIVLAGVSEVFERPNLTGTEVP